VAFYNRDALNTSFGCGGKGTYDVIVSNPPYVTEAEREEMDARVKEWEPGIALFVPNNDPMRFYRHIARLGREGLTDGGKLYVEINQAYGEETARTLREAGYRNVRITKDVFGRERIVTAEK
jgi:release factor glutamine methyltransferase